MVLQVVMSIRCAYRTRELLTPGPDRFIVKQILGIIALLVRKRIKLTLGLDVKRSKPT